MQDDDWQNLSSAWRALPVPDPQRFARRVQRRQQLLKVYALLDIVGAVIVVVMVAVTLKVDPDQTIIRAWKIAGAGVVVGLLLLNMRLRQPIWRAQAEGLGGMLRAEIERARYVRRYHRINVWASVPLLVSLVGMITMGWAPSGLVIALLPITVFGICYGVYAWLRSGQLRSRLAELERIQAEFENG